MDETTTALQDAPPLERPKQKHGIRPRKVNHALAGALLASGLSYAEVAPRVGAKNGNSLRVGLANQGITGTKLRGPEIANARRVTVTAQIASDAAEIVKDQLHGRLGSQITKLSSRGVGKLASKGQGEAAVLKTMAETWRTLNGNPDQVSITFGVNRLESSDEPQPVGVGRGTIEVQSTPTPQAIE